MGAGSSESSRSLAGVWDGIYGYPRGGPSAVPFTATLIDAGGSLGGSVHEQCLMTGQTLFFSLNRSRRGGAVGFLKTFQGTSRCYGTIVYDGTVNSDATEIEGRWRIPGDWSGRFLMTRSGDPPRAHAESEGAETRRETVEAIPSR